MRSRFSGVHRRSEIGTGNAVAGFMHSTSDDPLIDALRTIHGSDTGEFIGRHHVRYFEKGGTYHVLSRVAGGMALLVPTDELNRTIAGVLARALALYPEVELFAFAFMSNHIHLELRGGRWIPRFMRYLKGQVSLRVKELVGREGPTLWDGEYAAAHLPSTRSQLRTFRYILSHGVKEGLVENPEDWPGLHCAKQLFGKAPLEGEWFDGTRFAKAKYKEGMKPENQRRRLSRASFTEHHPDLRLLSRLPALTNLDELEYAAFLRRLRSEIITDGREKRAGRPVLGVEAILATPRRTRFEMPRPEWFQKRRRMIVWESPSEPSAREYLARYWAHQVKYRQSASRYLRGEVDVEFPPHAHRPCAPVVPMERRSMENPRPTDLASAA